MYARRRLTGSEAARTAIKLLPLLLFFGATVATGVLSGFGRSLGPVTDRFSAYRELFADAAFLDTLMHTLFVAAVSAALSVAGGSLGAFVLWRSPRRVTFFLESYRIPIILPHLVVAYLAIVFLAPSGLISSILFRLGLSGGMDEFPRVVFDRGGLGMITAYIYKELPFVMLMSYGVLRRVPELLYTTAEMLGANRARIFFCVILPEIRPVLVELFVILFLYGLGAFEIPYLLGSSRTEMLPIYVYRKFFNGTWGDRPVAMAALSILSLFSLVVAFLFARRERRS